MTMISGLTISSLGGLIQAAVGTTGGLGTSPMKRLGWASKAVISVVLRSAVS